ncbi:MAG: glycosyltransferase family 2 protein [Thalassolituus maritimus]|uniref:Glycosyl transferase family 2 n=1 Tax=Thalassolituus maritimus TaxID=484498 RepID=A0A1N7N3W4_9GAMM|nr:glycosyltransferase family 2 protein [Thalassolituus maritimus]TPD55166.1 MAG: glycosyltransferase family 2 protein [Thalassolituus maritimus]SIS93024.1 Glycosyl transferase family 2 [Thalassolituus maritimus]
MSLTVTKGEELVSIIMPTYNASSTIEESVRSVINQTYQNWELLITDDASSDNTTQLIANFEDPRIKLAVSKKNYGAGVSRNNSIARATGRYIAFLDSDDLWGKEKLSKQISIMQQYNYAFTYTYYQKFTSEKYGSVVKAPPIVTYDKLLDSNCIGCLTAVYDQYILGKHYMPTIRMRQDMALWLTLLTHIDRAYCITESLAYYRTDTGMTKNKLSAARAQWDLYTKTVGLSKKQSLSRMLKYSVHGLIKKLK